MYDLSMFGRMLADQKRMLPHIQALERAVRPGDVVVDLGAGTGFFALMACRLGARHVYSIEPLDSLLLGPALAAANGYTDRITFIQDLSTKVTLPEKADVIISDMRGSVPLFQQWIPSLADARKRLLAPGGILIPQRDTLWAAVVEVPDLYEQSVRGWEDDRYGFNMEPVRRALSTTWSKVLGTREQHLAQPQIWVEVDYTTREDADVRGTLTWEIERAGTAHGFHVWFESQLWDDISVSNAPENQPMVWGGMVCSFTQPTQVEAGDVITSDLRADLLGEDYVWSWNTQFLRQGDAKQVFASYRQSSLQILSPKQLQRQRTTYKPQIDVRGEADRNILAWMDGETTLEEMAQRLQAQFPAQFPSRREAFAQVSQLSEKYSR